MEQYIKVRPLMNTSRNPGQPGMTSSTALFLTAEPHIRIVPLAAPMLRSRASSEGTGKLGHGRCNSRVAWWKANCKTSCSVEFGGVKP